MLLSMTWILNVKPIRYILLIVGIFIISLLIIYTDPEQILTALVHSKPKYILIGLAIYSISFCIRALKWNRLLNSVTNKRVTLWTFLPIYLFNGMISNFTPAKSGDAIGPILFNKYFGSAIGSGFSVIFIDRFIESIFLGVGMFIFSVYYYYTFSNVPSFSNIVMKGLLFLFILFCVVFVVFFLRGRIYQILDWCEKKASFSVLKKLLNFLDVEATRFYNGIHKVRMSRVGILTLINLTSIAWLCDVSMVYMMLSSVFKVNLLHVAAAFFMATGLSIISFIPLGLGAGEITLYYFLSLDGYEPSLLTAGILVTRIIPLFLIIFYGVVSYFMLKKIK